MELIVTSIVTIFAAGFGAWAGVKLAAKEGEKSQRAFLTRIDKTANSLSAIARRLPAGEAYAAVKREEAKR